jgi:hypothetical protein
VESVAGLSWNGWPACRGIAGRHAGEYASRSPDRPGYPRRRDREPGAPADRRTNDGRDHRRRTAFFLTLLKPDNSPLGVPVNTRDSSVGAEAGEAVGIAQTSELRHSAIMPSFQTAESPLANLVLEYDLPVIRRQKLPTRSHEGPQLLSESV